MGVLAAENITFQYPQSDAPVLLGFSARFERGNITVVSGDNGSGKTTLTKLLVGVLRPSAGRVIVDGNDIASMDLFEIGRHVGYVFQNPNRQLFCDTVYNEVAYGLRNMGLGEEQVEQKVCFHLDFFGLSRFREVYPGILSLGEKQRLALAAVIALGTGYLVLDEPATGLDARRQLELGEILLKLRRQNCGIMIVSHSSDFAARYADRELVIKR